MSKYTTTTAALKATTVDIRTLDAKTVSINGKNVLDYINNYDTRDPQLKNDELDIWNTELSLSDNGHIEVKPHAHSIEYSADGNGHVYEGITESQVNAINSAVKVIDNEVLGANDEHIMYWQTDGLEAADNVLFSEGSTYRTNITTFTSDLSSLTSGASMFNSCSNLTIFTSDLSSLTFGFAMFFRTNLTTFTSDLPNLTEGYGMFYGTNLTTFTSDLSSLTQGAEMFCECTNLTSFSSALPSLTNGAYMFDNCKLDAQSVANIIHTLPTHETSGSISIGIGCDNTEADQLLFAQECDCETWQELLDDFSAKNWTVTFQYKGRPTEATTYNMRKGKTLPVYAKLEEVTDDKYAQYTSADGSKFFNINYFHSTNGSTEDYDVFPSLEEAIAAYNVTPKN